MKYPTTSSVLLTILIASNVFWGLHCLDAFEAFIIRPLFFSRPEVNESFEGSPLTRSFTIICRDLRDPDYDFPDDVLSDNGEALLSWRVPFTLRWDDNPKLSEVDLSQPWDFPGNLNAFVDSFPFCCEPETPSGTTCFVRIKEIHDAVKKGTLSQEELREKAYIVLLKPQYAVPVSQPYDISWQSLASGELEIQEKYLTASGECKDWDDMPKTEEEWEKYCCVDEKADDAYEAK